jgi:hypothetical protein
MKKKTIIKTLRLLESRGLELYQQNYELKEKLHLMHKQLLSVYDHQMVIFAEVVDGLALVEKGMHNERLHTKRTGKETSTPVVKEVHKRGGAKTLKEG